MLIHSCSFSRLSRSSQSKSGVVDAIAGTSEPLGVDERGKESTTDEGKIDLVPGVSYTERVRGMVNLESDELIAAFNAVMKIGVSAEDAEYEVKIAAHVIGKARIRPSSISISTIFYICSSSKERKDGVKPFMRVFYP